MYYKYTWDLGFWITTTRVRFYLFREIDSLVISSALFRILGPRRFPPSAWSRSMCLRSTHGEGRGTLKNGGRSKLVSSWGKRRNGGCRSRESVNDRGKLQKTRSQEVHNIIVFRKLPEDLNGVPVWTTSTRRPDKGGKDFLLSVTESNKLPRVTIFTCGPCYCKIPWRKRSTTF